MKYRNKDYDLVYLWKKISDKPEEFVRESEIFFQKQIENIADTISEKRIVMLSGPSASGKTTTANKICEELQKKGKKCAVVSLDNYYRNKEDIPVIDGKPNKEVVEALDLDLLHSSMQDILDDGCAKIPEFDFMTGYRKDNAIEMNIGKDGIVIFEGIHALNPIITSGLETDNFYKIYISPHSSFSDGFITISRREMRLIRRMIRDSWSRGTSPSKTLEMWADVVNGEEKYVKPYSQDADCHINTSLGYEACLLKTIALKLFLTIKNDDPKHDMAVQYINKLYVFPSLDISYLPDDSLLCEFIKKDISVY